MSDKLEFLKVDNELRLVLGWASVTMKDGQEVVDLHDDVIDGDNLTKAAMEFMANTRKGGVMHIKGEDGTAVPIGEIVFSMPFTADIQKAFGIQLDREGLAIGVRVDHDGVWAKVKDGTLAMFSVGVRGRREEIRA